MFAVDLLGKTHGWRVESPSEDVTRVSAAVMNGNPIAFYQDCGEPIDLDELPYSVQVCDSKESLEASQADFALIVSDCGAARSWFHGRHAVVYRPRSLIVGVGCRANVPCDELDELLSTTFEAHSLALKSIRTFATAEIKRSEPGIIQLAAKHDASLVCFDADALNSRPGPSGPSAAQKHFGVVGVCEPAAMLAANVDGLVVPKTVSRRATVAVARMEFARG
jgi:cobalt-precorrin 5A hydrolase